MENMREVNMEEMGKISGGGMDPLDDPAYWMQGRSCPICGKKNKGYLLLKHDSDSAEA